MGPPEYLNTIELKTRTPHGPESDRYWQCNVCNTQKISIHQLIDTLEVCLVCGTKAANIKPDDLRKLQAHWEIRKILEE